LKKKILIFSSIFILATILFRKPIVKKVKSKLSTIQKKAFITLILPTVTKLSANIGVPLDFMIAQLCLETGFGASQLFKKYFNAGGIKAVKGQKFVSLLTTECDKNKVCKKVYQNFAVYENIQNGLIAHSKILTNRYFKKYANKTTDPKKYAELLQSGQPKYATAPNYVKVISSVIDEVKSLK
jgi:flagellum-specific peptidoglycan hydrolase FlgJ